MPTQNDKQRPNVHADELISVTIDVSDLSPTSAEPLRNIISRYGRPLTARAFGDFQQPSLSELSVHLYQMGFNLVHCPTWPNGDGFPKSVVSDVMAQDLRDQLEELEDVETFLLVATSRDFIAVANALRRHDRRVVVVAEESKVCRELRMCADEFAILPPARAIRSSESSRSERPERVERPERPERVDRPERLERTERPERVERPERLERTERVQRAELPERVQRAEPPERAEPPDLVRLPSETEVLAEVRRIVAAEGICTPRRLARALCPVDRTPTGELRSRIANRIQALIDSGKLLRERLEVGGSSVETILTRDERNGRSAHVAAPVEPAPASAPSTGPAPFSWEPEPEPILDEPGGDGMIQGETVPEVAARVFAGEQEKNGGSHVTDLDALVESVLRAPQLALSLANRESNPEPEIPAVAPEQAPEAPKRSRSRRRTPSKTAASEGTGTRTRRASPKAAVSESEATSEGDGC